jgi:hypothetical protein
MERNPLIAPGLKETRKCLADVRAQYVPNDGFSVPLGAC